MNQILLKVFLQDLTRIPQIWLSGRWFLPFVPQSQVLSVVFIPPLLGTVLWFIFMDGEDLWNQTFSSSAILYGSALIGMIPKPNVSSRIWFDTNLFTVLCYIFYFLELSILAYFDLELEYSIGWLFSISLSTTLTFLFYGILLSVKLSTYAYFKKVTRIYLLSDAGNIVALGMISPYWSYKCLAIISIMFFIYLMFPYRHPLLFTNWGVLSSKYIDHVALTRCLFWGALSVWSDYIALTPFYILEMILVSESYQQKGTFLYFCKSLWNNHKFCISSHLPILIDTLEKLKKNRVVWLHKQFKRLENNYTNTTLLIKAPHAY